MATTHTVSLDETYSETFDTNIEFRVTIKVNNQIKARRFALGSIKKILLYVLKGAVNSKVTLYSYLDEQIDSWLPKEVIQVVNRMFPGRGDGDTLNCVPFRLRAAQYDQVLNQLSIYSGKLWPCVLALQQESNMKGTYEFRIDKVI